MLTEGSLCARHYYKSFASINKYLIWTTPLKCFTMPMCINGETKAQKGWMAEPGFDPCNRAPAPVLKSSALGLNLFPVIPSILEEEFPDEKDMNVLLMALNVHVWAAFQRASCSPSSRRAGGAGSSQHGPHCYMCSHFLIW